MKAINKLSVLALIGFASITSANAYDGNRTHFYIGADVAKVTGTVEGKEIFIGSEQDLSMWGFNAGYELNKTFSVDGFYSEDTDLDIKNYGVRFNARPVLYGPIYAVGTLGLNQTEFVGKGKPLTDDPFAPDYDSKGNANYERIKDKTSIDGLYAVGLGYRYEQVDFEVKYIKYADFDGFMSSLMMRF
ncbi:MAG: hypothetical protein PHG15_00825 [Acinetobacter sp.]|uniref:hypothetical protein n=1 Tax=Acinetobacter sp. TaxID=472 RepID=UPI00262C70A0|nr:hypothetical protein [Acinetobacter sp.]MDD2944361.1 hypothetical protein [Acinetobacter sp.]